ncbi:Similar to Ubiquitin carboxyl-terminal hydrolase 23; acc. no. Q9FPS4 [Pyronema omphalodes CBS 100304]|uniref:ubiquitinyl hydrolase 1 n=1 Tax=Pyronema omphalodes (strain CBS 100304) TaxID=1076935 RepID=U4KWX3_PYROM|nr:Similar to Ubiquitin carboxyl-terminal hydrolase 23; acc. no. Q9FPS4 [Pyronema omphalodes CBS 100304]
MEGQMAQKPAVSLQELLRNPVPFTAPTKFVSKEPMFSTSLRVPRVMVEKSFGSWLSSSNSGNPSDSDRGATPSTRQTTPISSQSDDRKADDVAANAVQGNKPHANTVVRIKTEPEENITHLEKKQKTSSSNNSEGVKGKCGVIRLVSNDDRNKPASISSSAEQKSIKVEESQDVKMEEVKEEGAEKDTVRLQAKNQRGIKRQEPDEETSEKLELVHWKKGPYSLKALNKHNAMMCRNAKLATPDDTKGSPAPVTAPKPDPAENTKMFTAAIKAPIDIKVPAKDRAPSEKKTSILSPITNNKVPVTVSSAAAETKKPTNNSHADYWEGPYKGKRVKGLQNPHILCYRNSALQFLACSAKFVELIIQHAEDKSNCKVGQSCIACALAEFFSLHFRDKKLSENTRGIKAIHHPVIRRCLSEPFRSPHNQEDASEYLMDLLSKLEDQLYKGLSNEEKKRVSIVERSFGSIWASMMVCPKCNHKSISPQSNHSTILEGMTYCRNSRQRFDLEQMVENLLTGEKVEYTCEKCKSKGQFRRKQVIQESADFVTFWALRTKPGFGSYMHGSKASNTLTYPAIMDLPIHDTKGNKTGDMMYELRSVLVHSGKGMSSGHYTCYVKQPDNTWALADDELIQQVDSSKALFPNADAYLLGYRKIRFCPVPVKAKSNL